MIKKTLIVMIPVLILVYATSCNGSGKGSKVKLSSFDDSVAYALGYYIAANNEERDWEPINTEVMSKAMEAFYKNGDSGMLFDQNGAIEILNENGLRTMNKIREKNSKEGEAFLKKNAAAKGVVTTESGLQYKILKEGTGVKPGAEDVVRFHYTGKFIDGTEFQSSRERGPVELPVTNLISGWKEALALMPVGSSWELYIPSKLAYGANGNEGIPPASTLIFELELLDIVSQDSTKNEN